MVPLDLRQFGAFEEQRLRVHVGYGFGGLHQPVKFVSGQSQSQLVQWGHGKRST